MTAHADAVEVRPARPTDRLDVRRVLDAAYLSVESLDQHLDETLVAVPADGRSTVLGVIVLVPQEPTAPSKTAHIEAIAVRRARRGQGIGSALVDAAAERYPVLTAAFDPDVRPFYETLSFTVRPHDEAAGRLWGRLDTTAAGAADDE